MCGLDLGSTWVKTVKVSRKGRTASLEGFARIPWTSKDLDGPPGQGGKVRTLWEHLNLKDKVVISSMAGHSVIVKRAFFADKPLKELGKSVYKEARQYIPFDLNDVYLDYQVLGKGGKQSTLEVCWLPARKRWSRN